MKSVPDSVVPDRHQTGTVLCSAGPAPDRHFVSAFYVVPDRHQILFHWQVPAGRLPCGAFPASNRHHGVIWAPVSYSDVIELFEIRKKANKNKVRSLASLL